MPEQTFTCTDAFGKTYEVPATDLQWRPSAYGIVLNDNKVLLSPQFTDNHYDLPGGGLDFGEMPEATVIREVKEETGLDVSNPKIIGTASTFFTFHHEDRLDHVQSIMLYYLCDLVGGELSTDGFDDYEQQYAKLAQWIPLADLTTIGVASTYDWRSFVTKAAG